jgi:hypothetical protein
MLGILQTTPELEAESTGQSAAEAGARIAAEAEKHTDLVIAKTIGVKFVQKASRVIDEELAHVLIPERECKAAGPALLRTKSVARVQSVYKTGASRAFCDICDGRRICKLQTLRTPKQFALYYDI